MINIKPLLEQVQRTQDTGPSRYYKVRMDRNERTHPFSAEFVEKIRSRIDSDLLVTYPEPGPLYDKMANFLHQPRDRLLFHTGSDLSIKSLFETYISPKDKILLHRPGYAMFSVYAKIFGAQAEVQFFDAGLKFDYDEYIGRIDGTFRMAVMENPNGFIGTAPPEKKLREFVETCEENGVLCVVDEAYFLFHDVTAAEMVDRYENLIVVRSFSKAFGLAGVRGGYLISRKENIANVFKVKPMHELTAFAILAMDTLLDHQKEVEVFIRDTKKDLAFLKKGFNDLGIETSDSVCNFIAARLGKYIPVIEIKEILDKQGILIRRPFEEAHLNEWVRFGTVPVPYEQKVLAVVRDALEQKRRRGTDAEV
ncbi:MAG: Aspartate aminotransferase [Methanoregula sp. PtaU1.Bin051]|nr:MAG: Aspartate aminotransferase [Methanoregula sp. PtaU1.Bin051]